MYQQDWKDIIQMESTFFLNVFFIVVLPYAFVVDPNQIFHIQIYCCKVKYTTDITLTREISYFFLEVLCIPCILLKDHHIMKRLK
jgi:hypothetical protein